jgi:predicted chitinase
VSLTNPHPFFEAMRAGLLGPTLSAEEVAGCNAILAAMEGTPLSYCAYALATAYRETASTMQPISEYGGPTYFTRMYDVLGARPKLAAANGNTCAGDGPKYYGRGYVQLTWKNNYLKATVELRKLGFTVDLVATPELALRPDIAAAIMRKGMEEGWFTGKRFANYLPISGRAQTGQYVNSRYIINGSDHAQEIASHAKTFEDALVAGGWK